MKRISVVLVLGLLSGLSVSSTRGLAGGEKPRPFASFKMQELPEKLTVGYAVTLVDVNGDGKTDIVVVDSKRVIWFENPTWKVHTIIGAVTVADNVCIAPYDIDGDGKVDFALGAHWAPANTKTSGTLQWLKRGKSLEDPWTVYPIDTEPTIHRVRFADIDGNGKQSLISVPLFGRNSSAKKNFMDAPLRVTAYRIPKDPTKDRWMPEVLDASLHVAHNFWPLEAPKGRRQDILLASYEGVNLLSFDAGKWKRQHLGTGNQENPQGKRGASEIKQGKLKNGKKFIATIEPWHGNQVVVYTEPAVKGQLWERHVIDDQLRWGHGVWCADLDGDGADELIIGVRDDPTKGEKNILRRGVRIYRALDEKGSTWRRHRRRRPCRGRPSPLRSAAADLNGDGRIDIVAVGRQTHNVRIYWNQK